MTGGGCIEIYDSISLSNFVKFIIKSGLRFFDVWGLSFQDIRGFDWHLPAFDYKAW